MLLATLITCLLLLTPINQLGRQLSTYLSLTDVQEIFQLALVSFGATGLGVIVLKRLTNLFN